MTEKSNQRLLLGVDGLVLSYGRSVLVEDVTFRLVPGDVLGVVGPNGSGKTTLVNCLTGWHSYEHGTVSLLGSEVRNLLPEEIAQRGLRRTFQSGRLVRHLALPEFMALMEMGQSLVQPRSLWGGRDLEREIAKAAKWLSLHLPAALSPLLSGSQLGVLSGGLQRFAAAVAVIHSASSVALLDEPFAGLARDLGHFLEDLIRSARSAGVACIGSCRTR